MLTKNYTSHAKINLGLQVLNKRCDGYHNIHSLFVELDYSDELLLTPSSSFNLTADCLDFIEIPLDESNLIAKAYKLIRSQGKNISTEFTIHVKKKIPTGSGLGGGSSNAATTLKALNSLWKINILPEELETLGLKLGSDVPFFIRGGVQLVEGIGDKLTSFNPSLLNGLYFLLVVPPFHISTPWAYTALNKTLQPDETRHKFSPLSNQLKWELFENDFERIIRKTYPKIEHIKKRLENAGALYAGLSGSGSTMFGLFDSYHKAESMLDRFPKCQTFVSSPLSY